MVEITEAATGKVVAAREDNIMTNQDIHGRKPLSWKNKTSAELGVPAGTLLRARIFFRAATVHAFGAGAH
jgi:hypothetical protein